MFRQMDGEKKSPDLEIQIWHVLSHKWILGVKYRITNLLFTAPDRFDSKDDPKKDVWISLGRGN